MPLRLAVTTSVPRTRVFLAKRTELVSEPDLTKCDVLRLLVVFVLAANDGEVTKKRNQADSKKRKQGDRRAISLLRQGERLG